MRLPIMAMKIKAMVLISLFVSVSYAETIDVPKNGPCPSGYRADGQYCVSYKAHPATIIEKVGPCPTGFRADGNWCAQIPKDPAISPSKPSK